MAQVLTDDDELELDDDEQRKRAAAAQQQQDDTIGQPLVYGPKEPGAVKALNSPMPKPNAQSSTVPPDMPAPSPEGGATAAPTNGTIADVAPYNPPDMAPRPESKAFTDWQAQDLAKHPVGQPRYHGLSRVADTIAQMTWPGQAAEVGGELGTMGARAKEGRLAHSAELENEQIKDVGAERQLGAQTAETQARAQETQAGAVPETVNTPNGPITILRKNASPVTAAVLAGQSRENVANTNATSRENVAGTNATSRENVAGTNAEAREDVAKINVNGKPMATKNIMGPDGKRHVMMWNPNTHTFDRDLGEDPGSSATSAYANTRTVSLIDPETGIPTTYQYNGQTNSYDKLVGTSGTGPYAHEMAQAGAVQRAGTDLIKDIEANRDKIGDVASLWKAAFMGTPLSDPFQSGIATKLASFAALNPALHGAKGVTAMQEFERIYGSPINNPDSLIAAIEAGMKTAGNINPNLGGRTPSPKQGNSSAAGAGSPGGPRKFSDWIKGQ